MLGAASATTVVAISAGAAHALGDSRWLFQFGAGGQYYSGQWADTDGRPSRWQTVDGYAVPRTFALFQPSAAMSSGSVRFDVEVGRSVGFAVRTQSGKKLAYYDLALLESGIPTRPLQLKIHEVNGTRRNVVKSLSLDSLSSLNRTLMQCAVSLDGNHLAAFVNGIQVAEWQDSLGRGSGGIGLVPPHKSLVYRGELLVKNATRVSLGDSIYQFRRSLSRWG